MDKSETDLKKTALGNAVQVTIDPLYDMRQGRLQ